MLPLLSLLCLQMAVTSACRSKKTTDHFDIGSDVAERLQEKVNIVRTVDGYNGRHFLKVSKISVEKVKYCIFPNSTEYLETTFKLPCEVTFSTLRVQIFSNVHRVDAYATPDLTLNADGYVANLIVRIHHPNFDFEKFSFPSSHNTPLRSLVERVKWKQRTAEIKRLLEYLFNGE